MATNYYIRKKINPNTNSELISLINDGKYSELQERVNTLLDVSRVHIGKSSAGWKFSFHYLDEFDKSKLSEDTMYIYLLKAIANGAEFVTEYGEPVTLQSFKKLVASKRNDYDDNNRFRLDSTDDSRWIEGDFY